MPAGLCAWNECKPCLIYWFGQSLWDQKCSETATMKTTRVLIYSKKKKKIQWNIVREWKEVRRNWEVKWGEKCVSETTSPCTCTLFYIKADFLFPRMGKGPSAFSCLQVCVIIRVSAERSSTSRLKRSLLWDRLL